MPLMLAQGAGRLGRHSVGTTVFGGMIVSTLLNLFFIPVLYVAIKSLTSSRGPSERPVKEVEEEAEVRASA
jgi:HAE1 family hydrophobic/amphiphilic exporter-1